MQRLTAQRRALMHALKRAKLTPTDSAPRLKDLSTLIEISMDREVGTDGIIGDLCKRTGFADALDEPVDLLDIIERHGLTLFYHYRAVRILYLTGEYLRMTRLYVLIKLVAYILGSLL